MCSLRVVSGKFDGKVRFQPHFVVRVNMGRH